MYPRTRRTVLLFLTAVVGAALVFGTLEAAPRGKRGDGTGARKAQGMQHAGGMNHAGFAERLGLTAEQKAQFEAIMREHQEKMRSLMQSNLSPEEKRAKQAELKQEMHSKVEAILTPEQREKARQFWSQGRRGHRMGHGGLQRCFEKLDLTEDQKQNVTRIRQQGMQQVQAVKSDNSLTDQQKQEKIRAIRQRTHEAVLGILTTEQREKLAECQKQGPGGIQAPAATRRQGQVHSR
ncbi:MAG: hypothetical protein HYX78_04340 [Armatimonadetes bacterium]|nr:hypothetical protein [Armatimonadota bacterium]